MAVFQERLRALREEKGEKQETIARYLKVSTQSYSTYENGREPKYEHLRMLAEYFHVTTDYLLGLSNRKYDSHADNYPQALNDLLARVGQRAYVLFDWLQRPNVPFHGNEGAFVDGLEAVVSKGVNKCMYAIQHPEKISGTRDGSVDMTLLGFLLDVQFPY